MFEAKKANSLARPGSFFIQKKPKMHYLFLVSNSRKLKNLKH